MKTLLFIVSLFWLHGSAIAQPHPSVTLNWTCCTGTGDPAVGFHVQRATVAGGPYAVVATIPVAPSATYLDTAVTVGQTYYYVVTAFNPAGDGPKSNEVACPIPFQIPGTPSTLSGTAK